MNKSAIFLVFMLTAGWLTAQTYTPFIEPEKTWADIRDVDNWASPEILSTTYYKFSDDTVQFQGKVYYSLLSCFNDSSMTSWITEEKHYREEAGRVYELTNWDEERVLYDFNLQEGDSVFIDQIYSYAHVSLVDSSLICGSYRKTMFITYYPWNDTIDKWVEGIGSLYSTFNPVQYHFTTDNTYQLLCVNESTCQSYQNPSFNGCFVADTIPQAGIAQLATGHLFEISPNPMHQTCSVTLKEHENVDLTLFLSNSQGKIIRIENPKTNPFIFDRRDLPSGLYFLKVASKDKFQNKKLILIDN